MRISGLDDSVSVQVNVKLVIAVANRGACPVESIRVGEIRHDSRGIGTVWVKCPVAAARCLVEGGCLSRSKAPTAQTAGVLPLSAKRARASAVHSGG